MHYGNMEFYNIDAKIEEEFGEYHPLNVATIH